MTIELSKYTRIPSLPTVALEVLKIFNDPESSLEDIIVIVRNDPAIVGKLLKAANSPLYSARGDVTDLKRAVLLLGRNTVTPLVLSFSLAQQSAGSDSHNEYFREFWLRSFVQATAAEIVGSHYGSPAFRGECYTTNLLAGLGRLALLRAEPERYLRCLAIWHQDPAGLLRTEQEFLGFTHVELSGELLKLHGLPDRVINAIRSLDCNALSASTISADQEPLVLISRVADAVASMMLDRTPALAIVALDEALSMLQLPNLMSTEALLGLVKARIEASAGLFDLDPPRLPSPGEMLQDALEQLASFALLAAAPADHPSIPRELMEENGRLRRRVNDLLQASRSDSLTGIFNRTHFLTQMAERIALHRVRHQSLGLAVIDIDCFKKINDTHGHQAGDEVLKIVAEALLHSLRDGDLLARYGGEEFVVLMDDADSAGLLIVGERLRSCVESLKIQINGNRIPVTISIGLCESPVICDEREFARQLFAAADAAMYRAKNSGRNRFFVEPIACDNLLVPQPEFHLRTARQESMGYSMN